MMFIISIIVSQQVSILPRRFWLEQVFRCSTQPSWPYLIALWTWGTGQRGQTAFFEWKAVERAYQTMRSGWVFIRISGHFINIMGQIVIQNIEWKSKCTFSMEQHLSNVIVSTVTSYSVALIFIDTENFTNSTEQRHHVSGRFLYTPENTLNHCKKNLLEKLGTGGLISDDFKL